MNRFLSKAARSRYFFLSVFAVLFVYCYSYLEYSVFNILELTEVQFRNERLSAYGIEMATVFLGLLVFWFSGIKTFGLRLLLSFYPILATYFVIEVFIVKKATMYTTHYTLQKAQLFNGRYCSNFCRFISR